MPVLLSFGHGYCAGLLGDRLLAQGWQVRGTTRSPETAERLAKQGVESYLFDRARPLPDAAFAGVTHVLTSIAPDEAGDPVLDVHGGTLRDLPSLAWVGWLGTTGVYGDHGGAWVDEEAALAAEAPRATRRIKAEAAWLASGLPVHLFRLGGIYGPGRNPFVQLRDGTARRIVKPGQVFSRIHVADIATVLQASMARPDPGRIYNVCDDEPAAAADVVTHAAALMGVEPPPEQPYDPEVMSPMLAAFYRDNRRVRNTRIKLELGVQLAYPTYRQGLRGLLPIDGVAS